MPLVGRKETGVDIVGPVIGAAGRVVMADSGIAGVGGWVTGDDGWVMEAGGRIAGADLIFPDSNVKASEPISLLRMRA